MKKEEILIFEKVVTQLQSFHSEMAVLVKKSPNDAVNKFKLNLINDILCEANKIMTNRTPFEGFSQFDVDALPSNSDVAMVLCQYINCLEDIRKDNLRMLLGQWFWIVDDDDKLEIRSYLPTRYLSKV